MYEKNSDIEGMMIQIAEQYLEEEKNLLNHRHAIVTKRPIKVKKLKTRKYRREKMDQSIVRKNK